MRDDEPTWQPLSALAMLSTHIADGVQLAREHLDTLRRSGPYRLADADVGRIIETWTTTADDLEQLFAEQGRRWQRQAVGAREASDVERFCALVAEERDLVGQILVVAHELAGVTIERLLVKA